MWEAAVAVLRQVQFWVAVGASLFLWWIIGVIVARVLYKVSGHPLGAAKAAAFWATILTGCAAAGFGWYRWEDYVGAIVLGAVVLFLALVTAAVCAHLEPQLQAE